MSLNLIYDDTIWLSTFRFGVLHSNSLDEDSQLVLEDPS